MCTLLRQQMSRRACQPPIESIVPKPEQIAEGLKTVRRKIQVVDRDSEVDILEKACEMEAKTSQFYERMVAGLSGEIQSVFARFMEIEQGHLAIVRAELDAVSGTGFWFDFAEFRMG